MSGQHKVIIVQLWLIAFAVGGWKLWVVAVGLYFASVIIDVHGDKTIPQLFGKK